MKARIKCILCGREYEQHRDWQKFCSHRCRQAYHNQATADHLQKLESEVKRLKQQLESK